MSQENVEIVRKLIDAFNRGDTETMFAICDPAIELEVSDAYFDEARKYRGHQGMQELFVAQQEVFDPFRIEVDELIDAGERVVALVRAGGIARASGIEVFGPFGHLWTIGDGRLIHFKEHKHRAEALEAVGLSE